MSYYSEQNFCPERSVGYLVRRIHQLSQVLLDPIFEAHGISSAQWSAMVTIYLGRATTCATIAREVGHDKGAMTRLMDDLEAKGLVTRERCNEDRRVVNLALTAKGEELGLACKRQVIATWNEWLGESDFHEIEALVEGLNNLKSRLDLLVERTDTREFAE